MTIFKASDENLERSEHSPFETERERHHRLWRTVIAQALIDACSGSRKKYEKINKANAIRWLTRCDKEFIEVCNLAGLNHQYVKRKVQQAIANGMLWRNIDDCEDFISHP